MRKIAKLIVAISNFTLYQLLVNQTTTGQYEFYGIYGKYIELILEAWKGEYEILYCKNFDMGTRDSSGNWTGQLGAVARGEADIGISHMSISTARSEIVDFSTAYTMEILTFAVKKWTHDDIFQFLLLFDKAVWVSIIISLISLSGLIFLILKGKENYSYILLNTFGNIIGKSLDLHKDLFKWKLFLSCWFLCAFVVSCSYSAVLLSFLTLPPQSKVLRDFRELSEAIQKGTHRAYAANRTLTPSFLVNSKAEYLQRIGKAMIKNNWYIPFDSIFTKGQDPKSVFIMSGTILNFLFGASDMHYISSDALFVVPIGLAMNKNFCCKSRVNKIIERISSSGLDKKVFNDLKFKYWLEVFSKFEKKEDEVAHALSLRDLRGSFSILFIGLGSSIILFIVEIVHGYVQKMKKETNFCKKTESYEFRKSM